MEVVIKNIKNSLKTGSGTLSIPSHYWTYPVLFIAIKMSLQMLYNASFPDTGALSLNHPFILNQGANILFILINNILWWAIALMAIAAVLRTILHLPRQALANIILPSFALSLAAEPINFLIRFSTRHNHLAWPVSCGDITCITLAALTAVYYIYTQSLSIKKTILAFLLISAALSAWIFSPYLIEYTLRLANADLITAFPQLILSRFGLITFCILAETLYASDDIKKYVQAIRPKIFPVTLSAAAIVTGILLRRHGVMNYISTNCLSAMLLLCSAVSFNLMEHKKEKIHLPLVTAYLACAFFAGAGIGILAAGYLAFSRICPHYAPARITIAATALPIAGWLFAGASAADYPSLFIVYTILFTPVLFNIARHREKNNLNRVILSCGIAAAFITLPIILLLKKMFWIYLPLGGMTIYLYENYYSPLKIRLCLAGALAALLIFLSIF